LISEHFFISVSLPRSRLAKLSVCLSGNQWAKFGAGFTEARCHFVKRISRIVAHGGNVVSACCLL